MINSLLNKISSDREWRYHVANLHGPLKSFLALIHVLKSALAKILFRYGNKHALPDYLSQAFAIQIARESFSPHQHKRLTAQTLLEPLTSQSMIDWSQYYLREFNSLKNGLYQKHPDPERYWNLHQFAWLLALILSGKISASHETVMPFLETWIEQFGEKNTDSSWRSFSISERLLNWIYLSHLVDFPNQQKINDSILKQAIHLANNLECYKDKSYINNHLINNARALYVAGQYLQNTTISDLGRQILIKEFCHQFTADGFLDEASTHYQLVFTRAYCDALTAALAHNDQAILDLLPQATKALNACAWLTDQKAHDDWLIPFFGDICPDPHPAFFSRKFYFWELAHKAHANRLTKENFSRFWFEKRSDTAEKTADFHNGFTSYSPSGYHRFDNTNFTLWWHNRRPGLHKRHAHNDWGSCVWNIKGQPILIDTGRASYHNDGFADSRLTLNHNTICIDEREQSPIWQRALFSNDYLIDHNTVQTSAATNHSLTVNFSGYQRLKDPVDFTRSFIMNELSLSIQDTISGQSILHAGIAALHFHPEITINQANPTTLTATHPNGIAISVVFTGFESITIKKGQESTLPGGYCSNAYDHRKECFSVFAQTPKRIVQQTNITLSILNC